MMFLGNILKKRLFLDHKFEKGQANNGTYLWKNINAFK